MPLQVKVVLMCEQVKEGDVEASFTKTARLLD